MPLFEGKWCRVDGKWAIVTDENADTGDECVVTTKSGKQETLVLGTYMGSSNYGQLFAPPKKERKPDGKNYFTRRGDKWFVKVGDGQTYERGSNIQVTKKDGESVVKKVYGVLADGLLICNRPRR